MKIFSLIALILFTFGIGCSYNTHYTTNSLHDKKPYSPALAYRSIARLYIDSEADQTTATGFAVDKDHLMTAAHFCISALNVQIFETHTENIQMEYYGPGLDIKHQSGLEVAEIFKTQDLCLVKKENHGLRPLKIANYDEVKIRDNIWIIGAPLGVFLAEYPGRVITPKMKHASPALNGKLVVSAASTGGVSGSPVINDNGEVIGVLVMSTKFFDHVSICVPGHWLHALMNKI